MCVNHSQYNEIKKSLNNQTINQLLLLTKFSMVKNLITMQNKWVSKAKKLISYNINQLSQLSNTIVRQIMYNLAKASNRQFMLRTSEAQF